jgi:S1-C subfamily serine protease
VTPQGPRPPGEGPDPFGAPDDDGHRDEIGDGTDGTSPGTSAGADQRGWLDPDDRLWRHPSEVWPSPGTVPSVEGPAGTSGELATRRLRRRRRTATVLVGSGAAAAVAVGVLLLIVASGGSNPITTASSVPPATLTVVTGCCRVMPTVERDARGAMISLRVSTANGVGQACGVVVAGDGLVATTLDAVAGARSITAVTPGGARLPASVIATDQASDVALVRVPARLPMARFADAWDEAGHRAIVMAVATGANRGGFGSTMTMWSAGTIRSADTTVSGGAAVGMAGIEAAAGSRPAMPGEALLDPAGRVLGIFDSTGSSAHGASKVFLPAQLVVGVAESLALSGRVDHGWLDIEGADYPATSITTTSTSTGERATPDQQATTDGASSSSGALVEAVEQGGASAGVLRPGEVIRSIDGQPVRSMAELRDRLYVLPPGARVLLGVWSGRSTRSVAVDLSGSP